MLGKQRYVRQQTGEDRKRSPGPLFNTLRVFLLMAFLPHHLVHYVYYLAWVAHALEPWNRQEGVI